MKVDCQCKAFQSAIGLLGKPWTALILSVLQERSMRFNELASEAKGPAAKVLSARLKELESKGLIKRHVEAGPPIRVSYELTSKGRSFEAVAQAIERFGRAL